MHQVAEKCSLATTYFARNHAFIFDEHHTFSALPYFLTLHHLHWHTLLFNVLFQTKNLTVPQILSTIDFPLPTATGLISWTPRLFHCFVLLILFRQSDVSRDCLKFYYGTFIITARLWLGVEFAARRIDVDLSDRGCDLWSGMMQTGSQACNFVTLIHEHKR